MNSAVTTGDVCVSRPREKANLLYNADALTDAPWPWLAANPEHAKPVLGGRGSAWFVTITQADRPNLAAVLRHYRRGGLPARLLPARWYLYTGAQRSRCVREYRLLRALHQQGLPVPEPLAAAWWRRGIGLHQALLTRQLERTRSLATLLAAGDEAPWAHIGSTLARFHRAGVWHADLNAHNILVEMGGTAWLIDFDRGWQGRLTAAQARQNLQRLRRSLQKLGLFHEQNWRQLLTAWQQAMAEAP